MRINHRNKKHIQRQVRICKTKGSINKSNKLESNISNIVEQRKIMIKKGKPIWRKIRTEKETKKGKQKKINSRRQTKDIKKRPKNSIDNIYCNKRNKQTQCHSRLKSPFVLLFIQMRFWIFVLSLVIVNSEMSITKRKMLA